MKAFLKRRWLLLSCAVVLLSFSVLDVRCGSFNYASIDSPPTRTPLRFIDQEIGTTGGNIVYLKEHNDANLKRFFQTAVVRVPFETGCRMHLPRLGEAPLWNLAGSKPEIRIPLWLPLAAILGWLVIRELRWREKRAKAKEAAATQ